MPNYMPWLIVLIQLQTLARLPLEHLEYIMYRVPRAMSHWDDPMVADKPYINDTDSLSIYMSPLWRRDIYSAPVMSWHSKVILVELNWCQENTFAFSTFSNHWDGTVSWNPSSWNTRICLSYKVNTMVADDLAPCVTRSSATIILT